MSDWLAGRCYLSQSVRAIGSRPPPRDCRWPVSCVITTRAKRFRLA